MKIKSICLLITAGLLTGCTSAQTIITPTVTIPTPTMTLTATPIPTLTPTDTPTPVPLGGIGTLMLVASHELKLVNADGSGEKTLIPKPQFEKEFAPIPSEQRRPFWSPSLSPDGKKLMVLTCSFLGYACYNHKLYLSDIDFKRVKTFRSYKGATMKWSPGSDKVLILALGNIMDVISAGDDFGKVTHLPYSSAAFWSSDGKSVYYYHDGWFNVQSDGTGATPLKCDVCSLVSNPFSFAVAESPDGKRIAIGTADGTVVIANPSDLNQFQLASVGGYVSQLHWSLDSQKLAVDINTTPSQSDVVILNEDGTVIEKLPRPEGVNYIQTCGWSPDGTQIDYLAIRSTGSDLYIHTLGYQGPFHLSSVEDSAQTCPVWLLLGV